MGTGSLSILWSIGIEEQFYLIYPMVLFFLRKTLAPFFLIAVFLAAIWFRSQQEDWIPAYVLLMARMDALAIGGLVAYFNYSYGLKEVTDKYYVIIITIMLSVVALGGLLYLFYHDLGAIRHSLFAIFFGCCLILAIGKSDTRFGSILRTQWMMWIGSLSYSLYLFHYLFLGIFHHIIGHEQGGIVVENMQQFILSSLPLLVTFLFSWGTFKILESPMVKLGKKFIYSLG